MAAARPASVMRGDPSRLGALPRPDPRPASSEVKMFDKESFNRLLITARAWDIRAADATLRAERFLVGGNAGGVVATLSLIGTIVGRGTAAAPRAFFWVLIIFLTGLVATWLGRYISIFIDNIEGHQLRLRLYIVSVALRLLRAALFWISALCAGTGIAFGLREIYKLTA